MIIAIATKLMRVELGQFCLMDFGTMSLVKLLWGIILAVGLSLLANLLFYLIEELFKNEKAG